MQVEFKRKLSWLSWCKVLLVLGLGLTLASCSNHVDPFSHSPSDVSIGVLHALFGVTLNNMFTQSATGNVLDIMFYWFNMALIGGAAFIFAFIAIAGVIYSSQDGTFLGKKWNSAWISLRTILGPAAIIPIGKAGFCFAQYLLMFVVYLGISIANVVWGQVDSAVYHKHAAPVVETSSAKKLEGDVAAMLWSDAVSPDLKEKNCSGGYCSISLPKTDSSIPLTQDFWNAWVPQSLIGHGCTKNTTYDVFKCDPNQLLSQQEIIVKPGESSPYTFTDQLKAYTNTSKSTENAEDSNYDFPNSFSGSSGDESVSKFVDQLSTSSNPFWSMVQWNNANHTYTSSYLYSGNDPDNQGSHGKAIVKWVDLFYPDKSAHSNSADLVDKASLLKWLKTTTNCDDQSGSSSGSCDLGALTGAIHQQFTQYCHDNSKGLFGSKVNKDSEDINSLNQVCSFLDDKKDNTPSAGVLNNINVPACGDFGSTGSDKSITAGGWWCAGNRYLSLDNQMSKNLAWVQLAIHVFEENIMGDFSASALINAEVSLGYAHYDYDADKDQLKNVGGSSNSKPADLYGYESNFLYTGMWTSSSSPSFGFAAFKTHIEGMKSPVADTKAQCLAGLVSGKACTTTSADGRTITVPSLANLGGAFSSAMVLHQASNGNDWNQNMLDHLADLASIYNDQGVPGFEPNPSRVVDGNLGQWGPVHSLISGIFNSLLGNSNNNCSTGLFSSTSCDNENSIQQANSVIPGQVGGVMQEIYNIGTADPSDVGCKDKNNIVCSHFSAIQATQAVGYDVINVVTNSMNTIFQTYKDKINAAVQQAKAGADSVAGWSIAGAFFPGAGDVAKKKEVDVQVDLAIELAGIGLTLMWLPLALFVLTSLFVAGIQFAFLVPMMPYILFWAGKVAWILLVMEGLVAAPLLALGIAYPDGHDLWGQSEPGMKMLLNVLLFPVLLIIGLLVGMCLTYVILHFTAVGFHAVTQSIFDMLPADANYAGGQSSLSRGIMACFLILLYSSFIILAFTKCFSAIYQIPERVMSWLGTQGAKFGEQELSQMTNSVQQNTKEGMQSGGQSLQQGIQAEQTLGKSQGEGAIQSATAEGSAAKGFVAMAQSAGKLGAGMMDE